MNRVLTDYYRLPLDWEAPLSEESSANGVGFFKFGSKIVCYGGSEFGVASQVEGAESFDAANHVRRVASNIHLPFSISEVIENLRREHYVKQWNPDRKKIVNHPVTRKAYYIFRDLLPAAVRRYLQKSYFYNWQALPFPSWPVDSSVDALHEEYLRLWMEAKGLQKVPFIWFWPDGAPNALIITHDVETLAGRNSTSALMDIDESHGFKGSIQVVPEKRYEVPEDYVSSIRARGFELNVHDLNHDGNLYRDYDEFLRRAQKINEYARRYGARGFRSGAMYRNLDWYDAFEFSYDMSVPNVAHLEPQRGGCCTVMPYFVGKILEMPLTTCQDYSLFQILNDYSLDIWKEQIDLIRAKNGLLSFISHPDYLIEPRARKTYEKLLDYLRQMVSREKIWAALPGEVDRWWRARSQMRLVKGARDWEIEGPDKERARVAYAVLEGNRLNYEVSKAGVTESVEST